MARYAKEGIASYSFLFGGRASAAGHEVAGHEVAEHSQKAHASGRTGGRTPVPCATTIGETATLTRARPSWMSRATSI